MILDTNALSAFAGGDRRLLSLLGTTAELALPVIVLGEYLFGIRQSRLRSQYEDWLRAGLPLFDILNVAEPTARHYADIRRELKTAGTPIPTNDVWIAALAREHRLPLVSRDRHFRAIERLDLLSW